MQEKEDPKYDDILTGPLDLDVQPRQLWSCNNDSAPSEARKRGSGGVSPRKSMTYYQFLRTWMYLRPVSKSSCFNSSFMVRP